MTLRDIYKRRKVCSSGSTLVELSMTLVPVLAFTFGIFDIGLMQFRWMTLQNAVREGSRYAVTFATDGTHGQDLSIKETVEQYGLGMVKASDSPATIFVNYYAPTAVNTAISCDTHVSGCSAAGGNIPGNIVEVSVSAPFSWMAPLSGTYGPNNTYASGAFTLNPSAADVLGGYPVGVNSVTR